MLDVGKSAALWRDVDDSAGHFFWQEFLDGLGMSPKQLQPKYFYDDKGAALFEQICELEVYYPTRVEVSIMQTHAAEMASLAGPRCRLVDIGSGNSHKSRLLLDAMHEIESYVPVDISRACLQRAARELRRDYDGLRVAPIEADFMHAFALPPSAAASTLIYFPGSTIGNLQKPAAAALLRRLGELAGRQGALLVGVDLKKDPAVLHAAYNDPQGVTAAFNINMLERANRELGARFAVDDFYHYAFYDARESRVEMQLVSRVEQVVPVTGRRVHFAEGEAVTTEYSYKYSIADFEQLSQSAGFNVRQVWTDDARFFSLHYLTRR